MSPIDSGMFLRTSTQRRADGSKLVHFQIVESYWDPARKRSRTRVIHNCGRAEDPATVDRLRRLAASIQRRVDPEALAVGEGWKLVDAWPHGHVYVLDELWKRLGIADAIRAARRGRKINFDVERALFAMVANRACAPSSKLYCFEQWLREDVQIPGADALELQHLYRAMDFLEAHKEAIEEEVYFSVSSLLNLDVELVFYDTTSLHFEVDEQDQGAGEDDTVVGSASAGGKTYGAPRKRGHSKNGRGDAPQVVVGLAVTRDGFPVRHWVFPGNTVDVTTVQQVKADLSGWKLSRCVFVGDAGMVSEANLAALSKAGGKYIVSMPLGREKEVASEVLGRPGRYKAVAGNLRVKEGERRRRYVVCHNPLEQQRQEHHRQVVLDELEAELASLKELDRDGHTSRACKLRASRRYGKYLTEYKRGRLRIDKKKVAASARRDGKFVVHSNDDTLTPADLALGYKQLLRVERAWRDMKSVLAMRPVFHRVAHRIHAHIALTVLALLLERAVEHACSDTWRNIRDDLKGIKLARLSSPDGDVWQVTDPREGATNHLRSLNLKNPSPIHRLG